MIRTSELLELLERHDRFLVAFAVSVLRSLEGDHPAVEGKLLGLIKGTVFPVPLDVLSRHLNNLSDKELARKKAMEALCDRHMVLDEIHRYIRGAIGPETVHLPLLDSMKRGETHERAFSHVTLALFGHNEAKDSMTDAFRNFPRILRWGLLTLLEHQGDQDWMPLFLSALEDPEPDVVRIAILALGRTPSPAVAKRLQELLKNSSEPVVVTVIQALASLRDTSSIPLLLKEFEATASHRVRATIISALGEFPEQSSIPFLGEALSHADARIRANAALALRQKFSYLGAVDENILPKLKALLKDPETRVRADAIQCLWALGRIESLEDIELLLGSPDENGRTSGAYLCGKLKLLQCADHLAQLTKDPSWKVRKMAALALLGLGNKGLNLLQTMLLQGDEDQQVVAAYAIGLADDPRGVDWLLTASSSGSEMAEMATSLLLRLSQPATPPAHEED